MVVVESCQLPVQVGYFESRLLHIFPKLTGLAPQRHSFMREVKQGRVAAVVDEGVVLERAFERACELAGGVPGSKTRIAVGSMGGGSGEACFRECKGSGNRCRPGLHHR